jgi:hypothetical protein
VSLHRCTDEANKIEHYENVVEKSRAELKKFKDREGIIHNKIVAITSDNVNSLLELDSKNEEIIKLKKLVEKHKSEIKKGGSATVIVDETNIDKSFPVFEKVIDSIFPTYKYNISLRKNKVEWVTGEVIADKDSVYIKQSIINEYAVIMGSEYQGLFKKRLKYVDVYNKNPYSDLKIVRTLDISNDKPKKFGIGINASYGIGRDFMPTPYVGFGVSYNLIRF